MTAKAAPWSKTAEYFPAPVDWWRIPELKRIRRADPANAGRWFFLISLATTAKAEGKILAPNKTPLTAEDFADDFGDDIEAWETLLARLVKEGLLVKSGRTYVVTQWSTWNREAAKGEARSEDSYRKKLERECAKLKAEVESLTSNVQEDSGPVQEDSGPVQDDSGPVHDVQTERSIREIYKRDQTDRQKDRKRDMDALRARLCLSDFSEEDFLEEADRIHRRLRGKPLSKRNKESLAEEASAWDEYAWGDKAGALLIAAQMTAARERQGKVETNPWLYAVRAATSFLVQAADINATNRICPELGEQLVPMRWDGDSS